MITSRIDENMIFRGYITHDPEIACQLYKQKTGKEPTAIIVRPGYPTRSSHPLLLESVYGASGVILVTHRISIDKLKEMASMRRSLTDISDEIFLAEEELEIISDNNSGGNHKPKIINQKIPKPICPHCKQGIDKDNFNDLGYWAGWQSGKEPQYWQALRLYVFKRDEYTCLKCQETLPPKDLVCHHIIPKESGGTDSARNLMTLCQTCHPDDKPIFESDD